MRVIKFRGFHADARGETVIKLNGKEIRGTWFYGDLHTDGPYINEHKVIPETVGQFVMYDRRGQEVYEGEVVRFYLSKDTRIMCAVIYEHGGFVLRDSTSKFYLLR